MSDEVIQKYDLVPTNLSAIQSLVRTQAEAILKASPVKLTRGRAMIQAEDDVARTVIHPVTTGSELSSWLAKQRAYVRYNKDNGSKDNASMITFEPVLEPEGDEPKPGANNPHIPQPHMDTDTFPKTRNPRLEMVQKLSTQMRKIQVGQVWSFPIASQEEGDYLLRLFTPASRLLGWRPVSGKRYAFKTQRHHDKIKLKRLG